MQQSLVEGKTQDSAAIYGRAGKKDDLLIFGIGYGYFKTDEKAIGGVILLLVS